VPENNPNYGKPGFVGSTTPTSAPTGGLGQITNSDPLTPQAYTGASPAATPTISGTYGDNLPTGTPKAGTPAVGSTMAVTGPTPSGSVDYAAPTTQASGQATNGILPGWQDAGGGWAFNPATGQRIPMNNPWYQTQLANAGGGGTPPPATGTGGGAPTAPSSPSEPGGTAPPGGTTGGGAGNTTTEGGTGTTPPSTGANDTQDANIRNILLKLMNQDPTKVDPNDPSVINQTAPYAAARQRATDQEISTGAEGAFANQQDYGAPEQMAARERAGADIANETGQVVGNEVNARRQERTTSIGQAADLINTDISNRLKQEGLTQTGQLGNRELDIRQELGKLGLSDSMIETLMRDQEFMASLGVQAGSTAATLNNQAGIAALG
jgi:hypothetical protein